MPKQFNYCKTYDSGDPESPPDDRVIDVVTHSEHSESVTLDFDHEIDVDIPYGMLVDLGYAAVRHYREKFRKRITCGKDTLEGCGKQFYVYYNDVGYSKCPVCKNAIKHVDNWFEVKRPWREI